MRRLDARAVGRNTRVHDPKIGNAASQQVGEAFIGFGIDAPDERVSNEQHCRSSVALKLDIPEAESVMLHMDRSGVSDDRARIGYRRPTQIRVIAVGKRALACAFPQYSQIDDAK